MFVAIGFDHDGAIGATAPHSYENSGHYNTLPFIVTGAGVVVANGGASSRLAAALHDEIRKVADHPVVLVINENRRGHAMPGNGCWRDLGMEPLAPASVIPGHGHPTNMAQARCYAGDYLLDIRARIGAHLEDGGDLAGAFYVDKSGCVHLDTFEQLATRNAGRVFEKIEWE